MRPFTVVDHHTLVVAVAGFKNVASDLPVTFDEFHLQVFQPLHVFVHAAQVGHDLFQAGRVVVAIVTLGTLPTQEIASHVERALAFVGNRHRNPLKAMGRFSTLAARSPLDAITSCCGVRYYENQMPEHI